MAISRMLKSINHQPTLSISNPCLSWTSCTVHTILNPFLSKLPAVMGQERFLGLPTARGRLYLSQRGWRDVRGGWVHDPPHVTCKRCIEDGDVCTVPLITPMDSSPVGYRSRTCPECTERGQVRTELIEIIVSEAYNGAGRSAERSSASSHPQRAI